jgi:hypothetical protein
MLPCTLPAGPTQRIRHYDERPYALCTYDHHHFGAIRRGARAEDAVIAPDVRIRRNAEVVSRELHEAVGLLHLGTGLFYRLNRTGALIWDLIAPGPSLEDLLAALAGLVEGNPPIADDVSAFLTELGALDLIEMVTPGS